MSNNRAVEAEFDDLLAKLMEGKRKDKKQGLKNIASACDYLESEGVEINAGTVSRHLQVRGMKPKSSENIRKDSDGYMLYVNTRRRYQENARKSVVTPSKKNATENDVYSPIFWREREKEELIMILISALIEKKSLKRENDVLKGEQNDLFDPDRALALYRGDSNMAANTVKSGNQSLDTLETSSEEKEALLDDVKTVYKIIRDYFGDIELDYPHVNVQDEDGVYDNYFFRSGTFFKVAENLYEEGGL